MKLVHLVNHIEDVDEEPPSTLFEFLITQFVSSNNT